MDKTRQYATSLDGIRADHVKRYKLASVVLRGRKVLDLACGCGYGSKFLQDSGFEVTGMDVSKEALDWAKEHFPGPEYVQMDATDPHLKMFEWDSCISFETIEHLKDPSKFLCNLDVRELICSVPNQDRYPFDPEKFKHDDYPHQRHYTPREFESLLYDCGFLVRDKWCQKDKNGDIENGSDGMFMIYLCE